MGGLSETGPIHAKEMKNPDDGLWIEMKMLCLGFTRNSGESEMRQPQFSTDNKTFI